MTNKEKVQALKNKGYDVIYVTRTDGSIRITKITGNGVNIKSSSSSSVGNNAANRILGITANQKAIQQRKEAGKVAKTVNTSGLRKVKITNVEKKLLRDFQAKIRKIRKTQNKTAATGGKGFKGTISAKEWRELVRREGFEKALRSAQNTITHLAGYSYPAQVEAFLQYIKDRAFKLPPAFVDHMKIGLEPFIKGEKLFLDDALNECYDHVYTMLSDESTSAEKLEAEKAIYRVVGQQYSNPTKV